MSSRYQELDIPGGFNYCIYNLPVIAGEKFRGPAVNLSAPFLACIGSAQTFGRFSPSPFPTLLGDRLEIAALNLGVGGAGPRLFLNGQFLDVINQAEAVVIQIMSGRSASNSLFDNSVSGGITGRLRSSERILRADSFLMELAVSSTAERFKAIVEETRNQYLEDFIALLRRITAPRILFWFSKRKPHYIDDYESLPSGVFRAFPQLVNAAMVEQLKPFADAYVECVSDVGLPQKLWSSPHPVDGTVLKQGALQNTYYPSPEMHSVAASALEQTCRKFLGRRKQVGAQPFPRRFVLVAAARTGTNLLRSLLNEYKGCIAGNELFNEQNVADDIIPWPDVSAADRPMLLDLRRRDPVGFWETLCAMSVDKGRSCIGFKLIYTQGLARKELFDHLAADRSILVIHLKRRNLLRRLVSERQAWVTGEWATEISRHLEKRPAISLTLAALVTSLLNLLEQQAAFEAAFANHPTLNLVYEDLAFRPTRVAERTAEFLGLAPLATELVPKHVKTGTDKLTDAIGDHDQLRATIRRWASFFDDP